MLFFVVLSIFFQCIFCDKAIICKSRSKTISCATDQVILIRNVKWGTTFTPTCRNDSFIDNPYCRTSVSIDYIKNWCDGQQACTLTANDNLAGGNDPCPRAYKYLDVDYTCERNISNVKVCEGSRLAIDCPVNTLIRVMSAVYGRHSTTPCPSAGSDQFVTCGFEQTHLVQLVCNGLQSCNMEASINTFKLDPCVGTYKYTDVDYVCEPKIPGEQRQTACDGQTFSVSCSPGTIEVIQANYGRHSKDICPAEGADWNTQCATNKTDTISQRCNGQVSCTLPVTFPHDPCVGTYKYLNLRYLCK